MKRLVYILVLLPIVCSGQNKDDRISLIKAPSAPASVIIGSQPSTISRPKSWQAVEASVYSNYLNQSGNLIIPNDFSLEVSPYWLNTKSKTDIDKFVNPDPGTSFLQNLSFSVSSTKNYLISDTVKTDAIGFGFRTMIKSKDKLGRERKKMIDSLLSELKVRDYIFRVLETFRDDTSFVKKGILVIKKEIFLNEFLGRVKNEESYSKTSNEFKTRFKNDLLKNLKITSLTTLEEVEEIVKDTFDEVAKVANKISAIEELQKDLTGFKIEIAGATALNFPTNTTDFSIIPKSGFWLTPSYQPKNQNFEFLAVVRYFWCNRNFYEKYSPKQISYDQNLDYGARLVYKQDRLSIEGELIGRSSKTVLEKSIDANGIKTTKTKNDNDFQWLVNINYRLNETVVLSYNFGKKFNPFSDSSINNLISVLSLNFGIGTPTLSNIK